MKRDLHLENYPNQKPEGPKALNPKPQLPNPKPQTQTLEPAKGRSQVRFQAAASACQPGRFCSWSNVAGFGIRLRGLGVRAYAVRVLKPSNA